MHIKKLIIKNFKKFQDNTFEFNEKLNILVGDNDSGKSTILEALEIVSNNSYHGKSFNSALSSEMFNFKAVQKYLASDLSISELPEILIEMYLSDLPEYIGKNNSLGDHCAGVFIRVVVDTELQNVYEDFIASLKGVKLESIPIEFYKIEWFDFAWNPIRYLNRKVKSILVDPTRLHPTYGKTQYVSNVISSTLGKEQQSLLSSHYRRLRNEFANQPQMKDLNQNIDSSKSITDRDLSIVVDTYEGNIESNLQLAVDDISFNYLGKGEQHQILMKLALVNKGANANFLMIEEPENHLSHTNLSRLIKFIDKEHEQQIFITTHSSYVLNKLSIDNLCLLLDGYLKLSEIDRKTVKTLQRLPGYDTLRVVLSRKVILVEGPSDELLLKRYYRDANDCLPEEKGIDIIVVRGIGFKHYLNIAKEVGTQLHIVKDNDGDYQKNIIDYGIDYIANSNIKFFSEKNDQLKSLEPALMEANASDIDEFKKFAEIALSRQEYNKLEDLKHLDDMKNHYKTVYVGEKGDKNYGDKKVDSAIRIFDSENKIKYPTYLKEALEFD